MGTPSWPSQPIWQGFFKTGWDTCDHQTWLGPLDWWFCPIKCNTSPKYLVQMVAMDEQHVFVCSWQIWQTRWMLSNAKQQRVKWRPKILVKQGACIGVNSGLFQIKITYLGCGMESCRRRSSALLVAPLKASIFLRWEKCLVWIGLLHL